MKEFAESTNSEKVIAPHKARILVIVSAVILVHAAFLLVVWPHRWPTSYKWLLLPDSASAYLLLAFGLQQMNKTKREHRGHNRTEKDTQS